MLPARLSVSDSLQNGFDRFFGYLPNVLGFLVVLLITYLVARILRTVVSKALSAVKLDESLAKTPAGGAVDKISPGGKPSRLIGAIVFYFIFLIGLTAAFGALEIPAVTDFIKQVLSYLPNIVAAVLIFVIAAALAGAIAGVVAKTMGDTPTGKLVETVVPGVIMAIAGFMVLTQLRIAPQIVTITYAAIVGMLALAGALAFGLGGRDVAARIWSDAYDRAGDAGDQAKDDVGTARQRVEEQRVQERRTGSSAAEAPPRRAAAKVAAAPAPTPTKRTPSAGGPPTTGARRRLTT